jgi:Sulfite exporter TauE/SafE.
VTLTSVGAGALGAVLLRALYPLRMQAQKMIATDTIHAIPVSLLGGLSYLLLGFTDLKILALLLIGSIPAALIGGFLVARLPIKITRNILAATLILASIKLFNG